jgi:hypothetical protein
MGEGVAGGGKYLEGGKVDVENGSKFACVIMG